MALKNVKKQVQKLADLEAIFIGHAGTFQYICPNIFFSDFKRILRLIL